MSWKCDRRIWRGKNGKLYEDGDPRAQVLVAAVGDELPNKPVVEKALHPTEDKAIKPGRNKAVPEPFPPLEDDEEKDPED